MLSDYTPNPLEARIKQIEKENEELGKQLAEIAATPGTVRIRYVDCGKCPHKHGPYLYVYTCENGQQTEHYVGTNLALAADIRKAQAIAKEIRHKQKQIIKLERAIRPVSRLSLASGRPPRRSR